VVALACDVLNRPAESLGVLARLFVAPAYRREGTGGRPLQAATAAADARQLAPILDVAAHFKPAMALYKKHGWRRVGSVTVAFRDRDLNEFVYVGPGRSCGRATLARSLTDVPARAIWRSPQPERVGASPGSLLGWLRQPARVNECLLVAKPVRTTCFRRGRT
jgi:hypothetical protein